MLPNHLPVHLLEIQRSLLESGVQLAVDEDAGVQVALHELAQALVFGHDAPVHGGDVREVGRGGVFVAEDLVVHCGVVGAGGEETLDHEEVSAISREYSF